MWAGYDVLQVVRDRDRDRGRARGRKGGRRLNVVNFGVHGRDWLSVDVNEETVCKRVSCMLRTLKSLKHYPPPFILYPSSPVKFLIVYLVSHIYVCVYTHTHTHTYIYIRKVLARDHE